MKVALIISGNVLKAPYIQLYLNVLDRSKIPYKIISWNRLQIEESATIPYNLKAGEGRAYIGRLIAYLKYIRFVKKQLSSEKYDKVIVFTIALGIFLLKFLKREYPGNYVFDIRDRSIVGNIFKNKVAELIKNSFITVISSQGFRSWLPKSTKYVVSHNCAYPLDFHKSTIAFDQNKFLITTIGTIRDFETNSKIIKDLGNHSVYQLKFVGSGPSLTSFKQIVTDNGFTNVEFTGIYKKEEELGHLKGTHFINLLINLTINSKTCMGNRMYLAAITGIPLLVNADTFQAEIVAKYNLGCVIDFDEQWITQMESHIKSFDRELFNKGRQEFLLMVKKDIEFFELYLEDYLRNTLS
jgi:hypothetical protein